MIGDVWAEAAHCWCVLALQVMEPRRGHAGDYAAVFASLEYWDARRWCNRTKAAR